MNKSFIDELEKIIKHFNKNLEKFYKENGDDYAEYSEEAKQEIITIETTLSTTKYIRDIYLEIEK